MKPKFGIIGCGGIARFHFNGLKKTGAEIVHISDINEKTAQPYVEAFSTKYSKDYRELINDPDVTVVSVLTSGKHHYEICKAALKAGKDVICEKTMMDNVEQAEEIVKLALESGCLFFAAYMKGFFPASKKAIEILPCLGKLYSANVRVYQPWGNLFDLENTDDYAWTIANYGGAATKMAGSHMINMTLNLLGRPEGVYANLDFISNSSIDRKATALFEYRDGLTVIFEAITSPHKKIGFERNGWDERIEINGVKGRIEIFYVMWDHPENNGAILVHYDDEKGTSTEYRFDAINPFDIEMEYFFDCLKERKQGKPSVIDGFNVDVVIDAIFQSAKNKERILIDWCKL